MFYEFNDVVHQIAATSEIPPRIGWRGTAARTPEPIFQFRLGNGDLPTRRLY
jgi:hypothetical protein